MRAERQTHDGAQMILELTGERAFDGPVTGVVDARGHFVGEQAAVLFEKFDGEDADVLEFVENAARGFFGGALDGGIESRGGSEGEAEDAAAMVVLDQRIDGGFARAGADSEDAEFAGERNEAFEDERCLARPRGTRQGRRAPRRRNWRWQLILGASDIFGGAQQPLALCRRSPCGTFSAWRAGRLSLPRRRALDDRDRRELRRGMPSF